jgi:Domain of unknown function (DUF4166)
MRKAALFPGLLGAEFSTLDAAVRAVHAGISGQWAGMATVHRGRHPLLRIAGLFARLPAAQRDAITQVHIEVQNGRERWTRRFGASTPMRSTLRADGKYLIEQLGLVTLRFRVLAVEGGMEWHLEQIAFAGLPLPVRWFHVGARASSLGDDYGFDVAVDVGGLGRLIRYEGSLKVTRG